MQQSPSTRQILDLDFQKELYQEDLRKLISNIQDKSKMYADTRVLQNDLIQKIVRVCQQKYEDDIIKKRVELQEIRHKSDELKQQQDEELSNLELELKSKITAVFIRFQKQYEKIATEKTKLEEFILSDQLDNDYSIILQTVHQSLSDFELAKENECINQQTFLSLKSPSLHTKQHSKISHLHSYISTLIYKIDQADSQILNNNQIDKQEIQIILSQKLTLLKQQIRQIQQTNLDCIQELYDLQTEFMSNQRNFKNRRLSSQTLFQKEEDLKNQEINSLQQQKNEIEKNIKQYNIILAQESNQRKDYDENIFRLITLSSSLIQSLNNSIEQFRLQLESMTPDSSSQTNSTLKKLSIMVNQKKRHTENQASELYNLTKSVYFRRKPLVEKLGSIKTEETNSSTQSFKHSSKSPSFRNQIFPEKQTALPLKCACPPECQCQQYVQEQLHTCNNQLYINQKGSLLCQVCQTTCPINEYQFFCQFNKTKLKFKQFGDFLYSFWKHITTLTLNQQIIDFWMGLIINCKNQWIGSSPRLPAITTDEILINFHSNCPSQSNCNHKSLLPQIHQTCGTQLLLSNYGDIICKRCSYKIFLQFHFVQCPETIQYSSFHNVEEFVLQIDPYIKQLIRQEKNDYNSFLQSLIANVNKRWK